METFWTSLDSFEKVLWGIAIPASLIFLFQTIMTFFGMDGDDLIGGDVDASGSFDASHPFTFRNFINFMLGFSWMGISLYAKGLAISWIIFISTLGGLFLVAMVMAMFYFVSKLEISANIELDQTIGHYATVYIPIYAHATGKVQVNINGSVREFDAITSGADLKTGELVCIKEIIDEHILRVERV